MFLEPSALLTFILASVAMLIVPGPSVTVIVANSLKSGTRAGLLNIAGIQVGLVILLILLALGLEALTTTLAWLFDWLRLAGAAYLVWLGYNILRSDGRLTVADDRKRPGGSFFWQGFLVILSNPKVLFFFGAFLPQFVNPAENTAIQILFLGAIFMGLATVLDGLYAFTAGKAGTMLTKRRVRTVEIGSGSLMIGGGVWLAFSRNS